MSYIILLALMIWAISAIVKSASAKKAERNRQRQIARLNAEAKQRQIEAARIREEWKQRQAEAKIEVQRMVALEEAQMRMKIAEADAWRKQEAWNAKQEEINRKHDEQIAKLQFKVEQATSDIEYITEQLGELYALLDIAENQQMMAVPGSKADASAQNKVISLKNRIRTAEKKLDKAKFDKEQAERKLA